MSKDIKKVPQLRFPGFEGEWESEKIGNLGNTYTGLSGKTKEDFGKGSAKFVTYMNVFSNSFADLAMNEKIEIDEKQNTVKYGDVFFTVSSETPNEVGMSSVWLGNEENVYLNSFCFGFRLKKKVDLYYLGYLLRSPSIRSKLIFLAQGISRYNISKTKVLEISVLLPNLQEQQKIGAFFRQLDDLIKFQEHNLKHLKLQKQALLQKMFPRNGSNIPEIRFTGYLDAWEFEKIGNLGNTYTGLTGKVKEDFGKGSAKFVTYMNVFSNSFSDLTINEKIEIDEKQNAVEYGDVFFTVSSETPNEVGMSSVWLGNEENVYLNSFCFGFRLKKKVDLYYLGYLLRSPEVRGKMTFLAQGISRYNISKTRVLEISISLPDLEEQQKIGEFFQQLDTLITLHERKLKHLKLQKKALLQQLFV